MIAVSIMCAFAQSDILLSGLSDTIYLPYPSTATALGRQTKKNTNARQTFMSFVPHTSKAKSISASASNE
jgi:hypothetical protein